MATMAFSHLKQGSKTPWFRRILEFKVYKRKIQGYSITQTMLRHRWMKHLPVFSSGVQPISTQSDKVTSVSNLYRYLSCSRLPSGSICTVICPIRDYPQDQSVPLLFWWRLPQDQSVPLSVLVEMIPICTVICPGGDYLRINLYRYLSWWRLSQSVPLSVLVETILRINRTVTVLVETILRINLYRYCPGGDYPNLYRYLSWSRLLSGPSS